jgi:tRNA A-37 threonylcarbamoyl transferase component Bud32
MEDSIQVMADQFALLNNLSALSNDENQTFSLWLSNGDALIVEQVVRRVANKRLVCRGVWKGQAVYAKLFIGNGAKRYAQRDKQGVDALIAASIATSKLLLIDTLDDTEILIFEAIPHSQNVESVWVQRNASQRLELASMLAQTLGQHHHARLMQTDLYLKNFLFDGQQLYSIDGDGIRQYDVISYQQASSNFAVLLSKFDVLEVLAWMPKLLMQYHMANPSVELVASDISRLSERHRIKAASAYADKKVFRQCTDVKKYALQPQGSSPQNIPAKAGYSCMKGAWILASSDAENTDFTEDLDALIGTQNLLKNSNTCTVALVEMDDKKIVIKRYNIKNFWHGISRAFRQSRAAASWANAHRLKILKIATAKPIALIEHRSLGVFRGKAYFLAEYTDAPDVAQYFAQTQNKSQRAEAVKNIATLFYKLYLLHISHGDMKATNIKMQGAQPLLIDLDSMRQHRTHFTSSVAHLKDLHRFMQNWQNEPALYNAFVKTFKVIYPDPAILIKAGIYANKEMSE